jgi:hypothetical protein
MMWKDPENFLSQTLCCTLHKYRDLVPVFGTGPESNLVLYIFFGGPECVGYSFAYVAHTLRYLIFIRDVYGFEPRELAVTSRHANNLATHPSRIESYSCFLV